MTFLEDIRGVTRLKKIYNSLNPFYEKELGLKKCSSQVVQEEDKFTVIGGGQGHSSNRLVEENKLDQITVYEPSQDNCKAIVKRLESHNVKFRVNNKAVGKVYKSKADRIEEVVPVEELEECDVLELDCEGSEYEIIKNINFKPRALIVEVHPWLFEKSIEDFFDLLDKKGFKIVDRFGHDGVRVDQRNLGKLLRLSENKGERYLDNGARWPVVILAVQKTSDIRDEYFDREGSQVVEQNGGSYFR